MSRSQSSLLYLTTAIVIAALTVAFTIGPCQRVSYAPLRPDAEAATPAGPDRVALTPGREILTPVGGSRAELPPTQRDKIPTLHYKVAERYKDYDLAELNAAYAISSLRFRRERDRLVDKYLEDGKFLSDQDPSAEPPLAADPTKPLIVVGRPNYSDDGGIEYRQVFLDRARHETLDALCHESNWLLTEIERLKTGNSPR